jgi:adenine deaminase
MQAISAATSVAARALGVHNSGQIRSGFRADLLVLDQNSLQDIRHTRSIHQVYLGGKLLDRDALAEENARRIFAKQKEVIESNWAMVFDEALLSAVDRALLWKWQFLNPFSVEE